MGDSVERRRKLPFTFPTTVSGWLPVADTRNVARPFNTGAFFGTNSTVASGTVKRLASVQTQCCEIHGVDLLVATVRPKFQPPPKARYSPTRLVVTDV